MSDEEINIAIAEACGWYRAKTSGFIIEGWAHPSVGGIQSAPPDYINDLNAMHSAEAEQIMTQLDQHNIPRRVDYEFWLELRTLGNVETSQWVSGRAARFAHATARNRAEAFLRTIGKWKEAA